MNIKDMVTREKKSKFTHYFDENLLYKTVDENFAFPVPISDVGTATFNSEERSMILMRYIRKQIKLLGETNAQRN